VLGVVVLLGVVASLRTTALALESRQQLEVALDDLENGRPSAAGERAGAVLKDWPTSWNAWQVRACGYWADGKFDLAMAHVATLRATGQEAVVLPGCQPKAAAPSIVAIDYGGGVRGGVVVPALEPERARDFPTDEDLRATATAGANARLLLQAACRHQHRGWSVTTGVLLRFTQVQSGASARDDLAWLLETWPACAEEPA
jgi:hypothetical protein